MYRRRNSKLTRLKVFVAIVVIITAICSYCSEKTYTSIVTGKDIKNYDTSSKFLIFTRTDGETRVFSMEDTLIKFRWNTADDYSEIEVGETYVFTVIGWRIGFLDEYENIIGFKKQ